MCVNCQDCEAVGKLFADLWETASRDVRKKDS